MVRLCETDEKTHGNLVIWMKSGKSVRFRWIHRRGDGQMEKSHKNASSEKVRGRRVMPSAVLVPYIRLCWSHLFFFWILEEKRNKASMVGERPQKDIHTGLLSDSQQADGQRDLWW